MNDRRRKHDNMRLDAERATVRAISERANCFADEVAIDFPSLGGAIDRMRDAFFSAERVLPPSTQLMLTPRQAFDGAVVPLDVPVRRMCRSCGGRGEVWTEPCSECAGTGDALVPHAVQLIVPPRVADGARFWISVSTPSALPTRVEVRVTIR